MTDNDVGVMSCQTAVRTFCSDSQRGSMIDSSKSINKSDKRILGFFRGAGGEVVWMGRSGVNGRSSLRKGKGRKSSPRRPRVSPVLFFRQNELENSYDEDLVTAADSVTEGVS